MSSKANSVHAEYWVQAIQCLACILVVLLTLVDQVQAKPRLFGTVEFQMDLKKQQNF